MKLLESQQSKMPYLQKQKFNLQEITETDFKSTNILLVEPEYYLRSILKKNLSQEGYEITALEDMKTLKYLISVMPADLAIISPHASLNFSIFLEELSHVRKISEHLPIITFGKLMPTEVLSKIMNLGVSSHLDSALTRPKDVVLIVKTIL